MKQKMTKLLSLALLIAMVLSLCVPTAFADDPLPDRTNQSCSITSYASGTQGSYPIVITGLESYTLSYEKTSPWITITVKAEKKTPGPSAAENATELKKSMTLFVRRIL